VPCFVVKTFRQLNIINFRAAVQRQFSLELSLQRESGKRVNNLERPRWYGAHSIQRYLFLPAEGQLV